MTWDTMSRQEKQEYSEQYKRDLSANIQRNAYFLSSYAECVELERRGKLDPKYRPESR